MLGTSSGARFALTALPRIAGQAVTVKSVDGTLLGRLHLSGLRITEPKLLVEIDSLDLAWDPQQLLHGNLMVRELALSGVRVQDDALPSTKPPQLRLPQLSKAMRHLNAQISHLQLKGLSYRNLDAPPLLVTEFSSHLTFKGGLLSITKLQLIAPDGTAAGEITIGFIDPLLRIDLNAASTQLIQGMDLFSLQAKLLPGRNPEQLSGEISATGASRDVQQLKLTAELGMSGNIFNVSSLNVIWPGRRGSLTGEGSVTLTTSEPVILLTMKAVDLDLERELDQATRLSGTVNFSGSPSRFKGSFALKNRGTGWQSAALAADYQGTLTELKLTSIAGELLEGDVAGALDIAWHKGVQISGALTGRKLNPGVIAADWPGLVNLDLTGNLEVPDKGALRGEMRAKLLKSRLHGQDLHGELTGAFAGQQLRVDNLFLSGNGFNLKGAGETDQRLNLAATVSDLSTLVQGGAGKLQADGWVRWHDGVLSGSVSGEGSKLAVAGISAAAAQLNADFGTGDGYPVKMDASLSQLQLGRAKVESALLSLQGRAAQHTLNLALRSPGVEAQATLSGGYGNGIWRGELAKLSGLDSVGPWNLAAPVPLMLSAERVLLDPAIINGLSGERIEISGELTQHPLNGKLRGLWSGVNLARADQWLDGVKLTGGSSGNLKMHTLPEKKLFVAGQADAHGTVAFDGQRVNIELATATLEGGGRGLNAALGLKLEGGAGEAQLLFKSSAAAALKIPETGDLTLRWSDFDLALLRPFLSPDITVDGRLAGLVTGKLRPGARLDLKGNSAVAKGHVNWHGKGDEFDAALDKAEVDFRWSGKVTGDEAASAGLLQLTGAAAATGTYTTGEQRIDLTHSAFNFDADQHKIRAGLDLAFGGGGELKGVFSSAAPINSGIPETGDLDLKWGGINPALLKPWLPSAVNLEGEVAGQATAKLLPGKRVEMVGETVFSQGKVKLQGDSGEVNTKLRSTSLSFVWRGQTLSGALSLALDEGGGAQGSFMFPIPARFPVAVDQNGALQGALAGKIQERGFFSALLPDLVQGSQGELDLNLKLSGIWEEPRLGGYLNLTKGGAYLPSTGIHVSDLQLAARLAGDQIHIDNFSALSGEGRINGTALIQLKGWQVTGYSGKISGKRFQTVHLPELQLSSSPDLSFESVGDSVTLRGEMLIPEMQVFDQQGRPVVTSSPDVIMEGATVQTTGDKFPLLIKGQVHLVLGDQVFLKSFGINAQLDGSLDLVLNGVENISSNGEIRVVKGQYRAYGLDLDIVRGRLYYVNGPIYQPTLDILALRKVGDVRAGVTVAGRMNDPIIKLYSEPSMSEADILAYMILGHPLGTSSDQGLMAMAASSLFTYGDSDSVQEKVKDLLGLSSIGVETVNTSGAGLMGYKEISGAPPGMAPTKVTTGESHFTVGKYLTPKLYLSYGRSLVSGGNLFLLRYDVLEHWQIETQSGSESGADIYYKLEFN